MFESLKGNEPAKVLLKRLAVENRLPQSLIFAGREGIGKKRFALEVAQALVCVELKNGLPCGECSACERSLRYKIPTSGKKSDYERLIRSDHPDVSLIVPNKNSIYIDAVRELSEEANFRPYEARNRIFIIDEAEKLGLTHTAAANALLKTLEEPAETTTIILITSKPSSLLQTIHSRCQSIRFSPISDENIVSVLIDKKEKTRDDAVLAARIARGSVGYALTIDLSEYRERRSRLVTVIEMAIRGTGLADTMKISEEIATQKDPSGYEQSLEILEGLVRDLELIKRGIRGHTTNLDISSELMAFADQISSGKLILWIDEIEALKSSLRFNINKKVGADALFVKMAGR